MMKKLALPLVLALTLVACQPGGSTQPKEETATTAQQVLLLLEARNMGALASVVHPEKGVRLSPYSHVDTTSDVVLMPNDLATEFSSSTPRIWGVQDGSGEPINLTFAEYFDRYLWDHNYMQAKDVTWNSPMQRGNIINNIKEVYGKDQVVEYHFDGFDPQYQGMDWRSLNLVFEKYQEQWKLIGIVHDEWTI